MAADLHSGTRSVNSPRKFEVERKFLVPPDFKQTLKTNRAWLKREIEFTDVYFDTPNNELTFAGFWLRKRDQKFELKIQKLKDFQDGIENYTEIEDEREIVSQLSRLLKACFATQTETALFKISFKDLVVNRLLLFRRLERVTKCQTV